MRNYYTNLSLHIIVLFVVAMLCSFIPNYLRDFLGDSFCTIKDCHKYGGWHEDVHYHWGYRHYLYLCMTIILFIINVCYIIGKFDKSNCNSPYYKKP